MCAQLASVCVLSTEFQLWWRILLIQMSSVPEHYIHSFKGTGTVFQNTAHLNEQYSPPSLKLSTQTQTSLEAQRIHTEVTYFR